MSEELETLKAASAEMLKALTCLYIAVDKHVADDMNARVHAFIKASTAMLASADKRVAELEDELEFVETAQKAVLGESNRQLRALLERAEPHVEGEMGFLAESGRSENRNLLADIRAALSTAQDSATRKEES